MKALDAGMAHVHVILASLSATIWYLMSSGSEMADSELVPYGVLCFLNLEVDKANPESSFR